MAPYIATIAFCVVLSGSIVYVFSIINGRATPTKSTWLIFTTATGLNIVSFLSAKFDLVSGAYGIADFVNCLLIVLITFIYSREHIVFKKFEKYYLIGVAGCICFWLVTGSPFGTNLLVQTLIAIGYIPTIHNIFLAKKSLESKLSWYIWTVSSLISIYPPLANKNILAIIYSCRSTLMCLAILLLTYKFQKKK